MPGAMLRIPTGGGRSSGSEDSDMSSEAASFGDMFFGFLDESPGNSFNPGENCYYVELEEDNDDDKEDDKEDESSCNIEENEAFWESRDELLQGTLRGTTSIESKVRQATKDALRDINLENLQCVCRRPVAGKGCRSCFKRAVCKRLISMGYDCAVCKSKWENSLEILSGEHTYLEVVENSNPKRAETRVIIELNLRAEFEMARASDNYDRLISRLPEVFVGKPERLSAVIKILCGAAKKCMKEKKMYLAPWRKQKYMQAKWLGKCERTTLPPFPVGTYSIRPPKTKASMLTLNLVDNLTSAVAVV